MPKKSKGFTTVLELLLIALPETEPRREPAAEPGAETSAVTEPRRELLAPAFALAARTEAQNSAAVSHATSTPERDTRPPGAASTGIAVELALMWHVLTSADSVSMGTRKEPSQMASL